MSVYATVDNPGKMTVMPDQVNRGRTLVYVDDDSLRRALILWLPPEVAAQWIEALTPLAEGKP